ALRAEPNSVVVHVGLGAQGSPNVLWLADRLGSRTVACLRGAELVCHRGDLRDRDGRSCSEWSDAARCRWCCSTQWWRRPSVNDLRNRIDLLVAGLLGCAAVAVHEHDDVRFVTDLGVPEERVSVGATAERLAEHVLGEHAR
ncbi:MAG: hypothetical protein KAI24_11280, partial [Planctomycetes bacterium]|nr:hypothetical protein [Planctomycetota bacterium]